MAIGLIGRKRGMTRIFNDEGVSVPVTVLQIDSNRIVQIKTMDKDGYNAVQVAAGEKKSSRVNKPMAGHYAAAGTLAGMVISEFRVEAAEDLNSLNPGDELPLSRFSEGEYVNVRGTSNGKGFAGTVKRHNFRTQDATHGNSLSHRAPGSNGMCQTPGRVFKGKKMSGQMGNKKVTVENLSIAKIDSDRNLILVKGAVPGAKGADIIITPSKKKV